MNKVRKAKYKISAALPGQDNQLPVFRDREKNRQFELDDSVTQKEKEYLGWETGFRVLPYSMQDGYNRNREDYEFDSVVLESECYRVTVIPALGGRIVSYYNKQRQKELLFCNEIFQPANLAIRNAWFAGGIELNIGQLGHTFSTCSPVFAGVIKDKQGRKGLRIYDFERCKRLFWQTDLYLSDEQGGLIMHVKIVNPNQSIVPMYWWTNIALPDVAGSRVLSPTNRGIYKKPGIEGFGAGPLPNLPSLNGRDGSYPENHNFANELFFQCEAVAKPWEALVYKNGDIFLEYSTAELTTRKLFCWGMHQGGKHWQEYLCGKDCSYIELQAGLSPIQQCSIPMPALSTWNWTQVFSDFYRAESKVQDAAWKDAVTEVQDILDKQPGYCNLDDLNANLAEAAEDPTLEILFYGKGWGRLEMEILKISGNDLSRFAATPFPAESLETDQEYWLTLLHSGIVDDNLYTGNIWQTGNLWRKLLEELPQGKRTWSSQLLLGIMYREELRYAEAEKAWLDSLSLQESALVYRNLAVLYAENGKLPQAVNYYQKALDQCNEQQLKENIACEYMNKLVQAEMWHEADQLYQALPGHIRNNESLAVPYAFAALRFEKFSLVENILDNDFALIREGELSLSELWDQLQARKIAAAAKEELSEKHYKQAALKNPLPERLDFRMD